MAEHKKLRASYEEMLNQMSQVTNGLNQAFQMLNGLRQGLQQQGEALSAVISLLGENLVQDELSRLRKERQEAHEKAQVDSLKVLTDAAVLVKDEVITPESFIVGQDSFKDGRTNRVQFEVSTIQGEEQKRYVGKKVGDTLESEDKNVTFTILEVYRVDKVAAEKYAAEVQQKSMQAQAKPIEPTTAPDVQVAVSPEAIAETPAPEPVPAPEGQPTE